MTLYYKDHGWITDLCDTEVEFFHTNMEVDMYIEWPEGIVDLGITSKDYLKEYWIFLEKSMYVNVYVALLRLRVLAKYLVI